LSFMYAVFSCISARGCFHFGSYVFKAIRRGEATHPLPAA
jgi:hypothetical protein